MISPAELVEIEQGCTWLEGLAAIQRERLEKQKDEEEALGDISMELAHEFMGLKKTESILEDTRRLIAEIRGQR